MVKVEVHGFTGTATLKGTGEELFKETMTAVFTMIEALTDEKVVALILKEALKDALKDGGIIDQIIEGKKTGKVVSVRAEGLQ